MLRQTTVKMYRHGSLVSKMTVPVQAMPRAYDADQFQQTRPYDEYELTGIDFERGGACVASFYRDEETGYWHRYRG